MGRAVRVGVLQGGRDVDGLGTIVVLPSWGSRGLTRSIWEHVWWKVQERLAGLGSKMRRRGPIAGSRDGCNRLPGLLQLRNGPRTQGK